MHKNSETNDIFDAMKIHVEIHLKNPNTKDLTSRSKPFSCYEREETESQLKSMLVPRPFEDRAAYLAFATKWRPLQLKLRTGFTLFVERRRHNQSIHRNLPNLENLLFK